LGLYGFPIAPHAGHELSKFEMQIFICTLSSTMKEIQSRANRKKKKSPLSWKNDLRKKVKRIGTVQGGEEVREE